MRSFIYIFLLPIMVYAQSKNLPLLKANSFYFRDHVFIYGFQKTNAELEFKVYKVNKDLSKIDSVLVAIGKENPETFLEISADTLHDYLNFYFQKVKNRNLATLIRLNDSLRLIAKSENFESNKINSLTSFEKEIYSHKHSTYTIRTSEDSLGKQFYLSKYYIVSDQKPFEYKFTWQYPLEKRNIHSTHVFYANDEFVFLYVNIISGDKKGQWVLKLNAVNGALLKGVKLNNKSDTRTFVYSNYCYDPKLKQMLVAGNIYTEQQLDMEEKKYAFTNLNKQNTYFFTTIDSLCENIGRNEKTVPFVFNSIKTPSKELINYHSKIKAIRKNSENDYTAYCSLYKSTSTDLLFLYETGYFMNFTLSESDVEFYADKIYNNLSPLPGIVNNEKKDISGKIELSNMMEFDRFLFIHPVADVERSFGKDDLKNPKWLLTKTDVNTSKKTIYLITIGKKGPEQKILIETSKYDHPEVYPVAGDKLILFVSDPAFTSFSLSLKNW